MKKLFVLIGMCFFVIVASTGITLAKDYSNEPAVLGIVFDGDDAIVPDALVQTIPGATDSNVYSRFHDRAQPWVRMVREGKNNWRIPGGALEDNHPYVGDPYNYKPTTNHCKLENIFDTSAPFIGHRPMGICIRNPKLN